MSKHDLTHTTTKDERHFFLMIEQRMKIQGFRLFDTMNPRRNKDGYQSSRPVLKRQNLL